MIHRVSIRLENVSNVEMPALSVCSLYYSIPKDLRFTCVTYFILYFFFCEPLDLRTREWMARRYVAKYEHLGGMV